VWVFLQEKRVVATDKPRPSQLDIAREAGVSPATVSRVLNNSAPVEESVRARVLAAAAAVGYQAQRSHIPVPQRHNPIALLIPDILNPYFTEVARGVQDEASADGYLSLLLDTAENPEREQEFLRMLASQPVRGIVACGSRIPRQELIAACGQIKTPMVVLNRCLGLPNVACILVDLENATYRAVRHLLELQHTRIAFLPGPSQSETSQARRRGIEMALADAGLSLRAEWCIPSFPDVDGGFQAMSALLAQPPQNRPTAVITHNDLMALGVLHAVRSHRLHVPEDISVIGIDDIPMAGHANPPLTTLAPPKYRMGRMAVQMLRRMAEGQPPPGEGYTLVECPLIVRESTGLAPSANGQGTKRENVMRNA
jgi:DNA-binding LacI/PurR family transcriptional regulator